MITAYEAQDRFKKLKNSGLWTAVDAQEVRLLQLEVQIAILAKLDLIEIHTKQT